MARVEWTSICSQASVTNASIDMTPSTEDHGAPLDSSKVTTAPADIAEDGEVGCSQFLSHFQIALIIICINLLILCVMLIVQLNRGDSTDELGEKNQISCIPCT